MKLSRLGQMIVTTWIFSGIIQAAEIQVSAGHGTLATAIADAADGDTLILGDGSYLGNGALVIDKSLVIRSINRAASSVIAADSLTIDAANKEIVFQGLDFGVEVTVLAADDIKVLEGRFLGGMDLNVSDYKTTEGDGALMVIGNHFVSGSLITTINSFDAYIAGNTFDRGHIISRVPVWIVGNYVNGTNDFDAINISTSGTAQVLANRVRMHKSRFSTLFGVDGIEVSAGTALIAGNTVELNVDSSAYTRSVRGIVVGGNTYAKVFNNIIDRGTSNSNASSASYGILANGEVSGNMIINLIYGGNPLGGSGIENNLCFNNTANNNCGSNAITTDPLLIDRIDYKLGAGSPAIDAGSSNVMLADLDRTRNDIGAYGGPWSIGQYDAQRDPSYFGPYVYPMFKANASFVNGQMQIRAIGVARLR